MRPTRSFASTMSKGMPIAISSPYRSNKTLLLKKYSFFYMDANFRFILLNYLPSSIHQKVIIRGSCTPGIMIEKQHRRCSRIHERGGPEYRGREQSVMKRPGIVSLIQALARVKGRLNPRRVVVIRFSNDNSTQRRKIYIKWEKQEKRQTVSPV